MNDQPPGTVGDLVRSHPRWVVSVWGLRCALVGLVIVAGGFVALIWSDDAGFTMLAVGMFIYLISIGVTYGVLVVILWSHEPPRPSVWSVRRELLNETFHRG